MGHILIVIYICIYTHTSVYYKNTGMTSNPFFFLLAILLRLSLSKNFKLKSMAILR